MSPASVTSRGTQVSPVYSGGRAWVGFRKTRTARWSPEALVNLEDLYRLLRTEHVQAQSIVDTVREPLLVLDRELRVVAASRSFFETFRVERDETVGRPLR